MHRVQISVDSTDKRSDSVIMDDHVIYPNLDNSYQNEKSSETLLKMSKKILELRNKNLEYISLND